MDFYSGHSEAKVFKAIEAGPEVGIRFDSEKTAEKHSKEMESLVSAAAGALTRAMSSITSVRSFSFVSCGLTCCFGREGFYRELQAVPGRRRDA